MSDETFYLKVRSVRKWEKHVSWEEIREKLFFDKESTAAALDFDDPGRDECNETKSCGPNEHCERVSVNAQIKRNVCGCDRDNGYRRINGKNQEKKSFRRK